MANPTLGTVQKTLTGNKLSISAPIDFNDNVNISFHYQLSSESGGIAFAPQPIAVVSESFSLTNIEIGSGKWNFKIFATLAGGSNVELLTFPVNINLFQCRSVLPDSAGNTVNSLPNQKLLLDPIGAGLYKNAIATASENGRRVAAATAIINLMAEQQLLSVFRNNVLILRAKYNGFLSLENNEEDDGVKLKLSTMVSNSALQSGDLSTGTWWFLLQGGKSAERSITGTVGNINSGKNITLSNNPIVGVGVRVNFDMLLPIEIEA